MTATSIDLLVDEQLETEAIQSYEKWRRIVKNLSWILLVFIVGFLAGTSAERLWPGQAAQAAPMSMNMSCHMPMGKSAGDNQMMAAMMGMMKHDSMMTMTGDQDQDFMMMMIPHHEAAVQMAKVEIARGRRPELKALAQSIVTSQNKEIVEMQGWLHQWYGGSQE